MPYHDARSDREIAFFLYPALNVERVQDSLRVGKVDGTALLFVEFVQELWCTHTLLDDQHCTGLEAISLGVTVWEAGVIRLDEREGGKRGKEALNRLPLGEAIAIESFKGHGILVNIDLPFEGKSLNKLFGMEIGPVSNGNESDGRFIQERF